MSSAASDLGPKQALIFRITHRNNISWILDHGLHCRSSPVRDPHFVPIGNRELIERRLNHPVRCPLGGTLGEYVPFYFTSHSPMFYNIRTGYRGIQPFPNEEIVIIVSSLLILRRQEVKFVFTDRHAVLTTAQIFTSLADLDKVDWDIIKRRDFRRSPDDDPGKVERYEAEALVYRHMPVDCLSEIVCYDESTKRIIDAHAVQRGLRLDVVVNRERYF